MELLLKLILVPTLLLGITWIGRIFGARVAGMLAGVPLVAGPLILFIAHEQGPRFAAQSATSTLAGEASLIVFCIAYSIAARRLPWWICLLLSWTAFIGATAVMNQFDLSTAGCFLIGLIAPIALRVSLVDPPPTPHAPVATSPVADLAARMVCGAVLVVLLTTAADGLGPRLSGLLTIFPVASAVLAAFSHRSQGVAFSVELLRGLAWGMYSFGSFFAVLALTLEALGTVAAACWALVASLGVQGLLFLLFQRRR